MHKKIIIIVCIAVLCAFLATGVSLYRTSRQSLRAELVAAQGGQGQGQGQGQGGGQGQGNQGNNGVGGGQGGGQDNNRGVGQGVGGGQENNRGQGNAGGGSATASQGRGRGGDGSKGGTPGRGLRQHAAALHQVLNINGLHSMGASRYVLEHPNIHPSALASKKDESAWSEDLQNVTCSMYRYLGRMREARPRLAVHYVDWIVDQVAQALDEDRTEVKAALLGYPHHHEHTSPVLQGISESGCAKAGEELPFAEQEMVGEEHGLEVTKGEVETSTFLVDDVSTGTGLVFRIMKNGSVFTDFGTSHGAQMHLFSVRDDVGHFYHLHPERDSTGTWSGPFTPPAGGTYWFYVDFVDADLQRYVVRFKRTYEGDRGEYGFVPDASRIEAVDGYTVLLEETPYDDGILLTYHINDEFNRAVLLDTYYGTLGHALLFAQDGDFIATYSAYAGDHLTFHIPKDLDKTYRIFAMFRTEGKSHTAQFDWIPQARTRSKTVPVHVH